MARSSQRDGGSRPYHHGDLRRALIESAIEAISEEGAANVRLRDVARRADVSHAAPAHHFGDKAGLLTAIAAEGFELLATELADAYERTGSFLEVGVAYVRFATQHRAHFEVMYRPELYYVDDPAVIHARAASAASLYGRVGDVTHDGCATDGMRAGVAAWSLVHGLATLWLNGNLPTQLGGNPEQIARSVASYLSARPRVGLCTRSTIVEANEWRRTLKGPRRLLTRHQP